MDVIRKAPAPVYGVQDVKFYYLTQTHQILLLLLPLPIIHKEYEILIVVL